MITQQPLTKENHSPSLHARSHVMKATEDMILSLGWYVLPHPALSPVTKHDVQHAEKDSESPPT